MKAIRLIAWALCTVPLVMAAGQMRPYLACRPNFQKPLAECHGWRAGRDNPPVTDAEWDEIEKWMSQNCPNRLNVLNGMNENSGLKGRAKQLIAEKYRALKRVKYLPLHDAMVAEAQAQDQIFGAQVKLREAHQHGQPGDRETREELRVAVGKLVDARINKLQAEAKRMQENRARLAEQWYRGMLNRVEGPGPAHNSTSQGSEDAYEGGGSPAVH